MGRFSSIAQSAAEQLLEDGELRSNLTDDEANILIDWAIKWLEGQVDKAPDEAAARQMAKDERGRLRKALQEVNHQMTGSEGKPSGLSATRAVPSAPPDRKKLIHSFIAQKVEDWSK